MIAYLSGKIRKKLEKSIILDTGNVGYLVFLSAPVYEKTNENDETEFFIYTKVREDDISLYGFESMEDLEFFKQLISVSGIGAKTAMEILAQNPEKIKSAIVTGDVQMLSKTPGIGKKTAERIIVELKNKITWQPGERLHTSVQEKVIDDDAVNALMSLGYQRHEILRLLKEKPETIKTTEDTVTYFLRNV